jgi:hypothetical protein
MGPSSLIENVADSVGSVSAMAMFQQLLHRFRGAASFTRNPRFIEGYIEHPLS